MRVPGKRELFVLLLAVCPSSRAAQALVVDSHRQPPACHENRHKSPAQSPINYQCCLYGHDSAVVPAFSLVQQTLQGFAITLYFELPFELSLFPIVEGLTVSSGDPPQVLPLRI